MSKKENKDCLIYRLEIKYNEKTGIIEYITETIVDSQDRGPIDTNFDYIEEHFDEEDLKLLERLYIVGES
jgi:hypothetical protein